jgi:hypothetical protein
MLRVDGETRHAKEVEDAKVAAGGQARNDEGKAHQVKTGGGRAG